MVCQFCWSFQEPTFGLDDFLYFFILYFINFCCGLYHFLPSAWFSFGLLFFFQFYIIDLTSFLIWSFTTVNFPPNVVLAASHKFRYVVFSFPLISKYFNFPGTYLIHWLLRSVLFNFHIFVNFQNFSLLLIPNFIPCVRRTYFVWFHFFNLTTLRLVSWPSICSILRTFYIHLRKMCILLLLGEVFYRLEPIPLITHYKTWEGL